MARPRGWGGDAQLGGQAGIGVPRAEAPLFSSAGLAAAARGLYTRWLLGCPPPSPPPETPPPSLAWATSCICKFGERAWGRPLTPPQDQVSPPLRPQVLDGIWVGGEDRRRVGAKWKDNPGETQQAERKADIC